MRVLIFLAYLAVAGVMIYNDPGMFLPGVALTAPAGYIIGRARAEWGRVHEDIGRDLGRRSAYRS